VIQLQAIQEAHPRMRKGQKASNVISTFESMFVNRHSHVRVPDLLCAVQTACKPQSNAFYDQSHRDKRVNAWQHTGLLPKASMAAKLLPWLQRSMLLDLVESS